MKFNLSPGFLRLRHRQRRNLSHSESGLTLLEALIAIIVIGLTLSAITPAFVLAVATRIQSQKADQAIQLARKEVDNARLIMELAPLPTTKTNDELAELEISREDSLDNPGTDDVETRQDFLPQDLGNTPAREIDAPTKFLALGDEKCDLSNADRTKKPEAGEACSVDVDGDGTADFAVQVFRVNTQTAYKDNSLVSFDLGIRVYSYDATGDPDDDGSTFITVSGLKTEAGSIGLTTKPGTDDNSSSREAPMAVVYTSILRGERENSLCDFFLIQGQTLKQLQDAGMICDEKPPVEPEPETGE